MAFGKASATTLLLLLLFGSCVVFLGGRPSASGSHLIDYPSTSDIITKSFGYATTTTETLGHHSVIDDSMHIDHVRKLADSFGAETMNVNTVHERPSGITTSQMITRIDDAAQEWEDAGQLTTSQPSWITTIQDNILTPSLFGVECQGGQNVADDAFESSFCNLTTPSKLAEVRFDPSFAVMASDGEYDEFVEADVAFNSQWSGTWAPWKLQDVAAHEYGHFFGLGDLYTMYTSQSHCIIRERYQGEPIMCSESKPIAIGDVNGLHYLYPNSETLGMTESFSAVAIDLAVGSVEGSPSSEPDFVLLEGDYNPSTDVTAMRLRPFEVDPNSYGDNPGLQETPIAVGGKIRDIGAVFGNVDQNGDRPDLVVAWVDVSNDIYYNVFFDTFESSENFNWGSSTGIKGPLNGIHSAAEAIDLVFLNMDADSAEEMVIFSSHYSSPDDMLDIYWAELPTGSGGNPPTNWNPNTSTGISVEDDAIGAGIIHKQERIVFVSYNADDVSTPEFMAYKVIAFKTTGSINQIDEKSFRKFGTLDPTDVISGTLDGVGADAYDFTAQIGDQNINFEWPELIFLRVDNNEVEFTIERDARFASHGTSDDY
jgi:hypothetical protein